MALTDALLSDLSTELSTDPEGLGYTGDDVEDAALLNEAGASSETVLRQSIPMGEVYAQVDWVGEWLPLSAERREGFAQLTSTPTLDATSPQIRDALEAIFGTSSSTWSRLADIATRDASRAEVLFGHGASVTPSEVADARRL